MSQIGKRRPSILFTQGHFIRCTTTDNKLFYLPQILFSKSKSRFWVIPVPQNSLDFKCVKRTPSMASLSSRRCKKTCNLSLHLEAQHDLHVPNRTTVTCGWDSFYSHFTASINCKRSERGTLRIATSHDELRVRGCHKYGRPFGCLHTMIGK